MTTTIVAPTGATSPAEHTTAAPVVTLNRRTIDAVLIGFGVVATVVFAVAGGLLMWGNNFSDDYVTRELSSQNITFPTAEKLTAEGRTDLLEHAGSRLDTGSEAEAYASYIDGHLEKTGGGLTYAELGVPETAAKAEVTAAVTAGKSTAEISALQAKADGISNQRNTMFKGETLRGLLLSAYAWSTVGTIAGIAALGAFIAAGLMAILVGFGVFHHRKTVRAA